MSSERIVPQFDLKLRTQQRQWNHLAAADPFWAILSDPQKKNGQWDLAEFFATGRREIADAMRIAESLGVPVRRDAALDFGCGAGRLTQALAEWFGHVTGVDISAGMLDLARRHNRAGDRCTFVLNLHDDLSQLPGDSFDMVFSRIVLQHLPSRHVRRYVREFVRVLRPGGLALFQLPSTLRARSAWNRLGYAANRFVRRRVLRDPAVLEMYGVPRAQVEHDIGAAGGRLLEARPDQSAEPEWDGFLYAVTK
jgi:SAM-dependent methyltransferase